MQSSPADQATAAVSAADPAPCVISADEAWAAGTAPDLAPQEVCR